MSDSRLNFNRRPKSRVGLRLLLAMLFPVIAAVSSVRLYSLVESKLDSEWRQSVELDAEICKERLAGALGQLSLLAGQLHTRVALRAYLGEIAPPTEETGAKFEAVTSRLATIRKLTAHSAEAWMAGPTAEAVVYDCGIYYPSVNGLGFMGLDPDDMPDNEVVFSPIRHAAHADGGMLTAAVKVVENGKTLGFMGVDMDTDFLDARPLLRGEYKSLRAMLLDSEGLIISHPDKSLLMRHVGDVPGYRDIGARLAAGEDGWGSLNMQGGQVFFHIAQATCRRWRLVMLVDKADVDWTGDMLANETAFNVFLNLMACLFLLFLSNVVHDEYRCARGRERILFAILRNMPVGLIIRDAKKLLAEYVNPKYEEMLRRPAARILGKPPQAAGMGDMNDYLDDLFTGRTQYKTMEADVMVDGRSMRFKYLFFLAEGVRNWGGSKYVALIQDVSAEKEARETLIMARDLAEEARKGAEEATRAKSDFLARMSHEIRTPMNAIIGLGHLMRRANTDEKQARYLEKMNGAAETLLGVINDILDFSKIESGKMEVENIPFSLSALLSGLGDIIAFKAEEKGLEFKISVDPGLPDRFRGDPLRIEQVLLNLVNNAIKFTKKGAVEVRVSMARGGLGPNAPERQAAIGEAPQTQGPGPAPAQTPDENVYLAFEVSDTGIGIPEDLRGRLFASFTQVDGSTTRKFGGTGLGLAICRRLAALMGGTVALERSSPGQGSVFRFMVRTTACEAERDAPAPPQAPSGVRTGEETAARLLASARVLLVEDNEINQEIALEILREAGIKADVAQNGREAVEAALSGKYDLVLMDIQMPVMDGFEATKRIRNCKIAGVEDMPILAMTANAMAGDVEDSLACGMDGHISKPFQPEELLRAITKLLDREPARR